MRLYGENVRCGIHVPKVRRASNALSYQLLNSTWRRAIESNNHPLKGAPVLKAGGTPCARARRTDCQRTGAPGRRRNG